MTVWMRCVQASLILKKFDKDKDGELGLEDMKALMKKINKKGLLCKNSNGTRKLINILFKALQKILSQEFLKYCISDYHKLLTIVYLLASRDIVSLSLAVVMPFVLYNGQYFHHFPT